MRTMGGAYWEPIFCARFTLYNLRPRGIDTFQGGQSREKTGGGGIDWGSVDAEQGDIACPDNCAKREHSSRYQRSGFEPASERSSLEEKTVNCGEFENDGRRSGKVLASLRPVRDGVNCHQ